MEVLQLPLPKALKQRAAPKRRQSRRPVPPRQQTAAGPWLPGDYLVDATDLPAVAVTGMKDEDI